MPLKQVLVIGLGIWGDGEGTVFKFDLHKLFAAQIGTDSPDDTTSLISSNTSPIGGFDPTGTGLFDLTMEGDVVVLTFATAPTADSELNVSVGLFFPSHS